jgi:predicted O-linked N-acetylglucosamine transferase (SPINDLY family)
LADINLQKKISTPFISIQLPTSSEQQKICAELFVGDRFSLNQIKLAPKKELDVKNKLRIGYFSSDFRDHPVGILLSNIIPLHDRAQFEIYGFFLNNPTNDWVEKSLVGSFDHIFNLSKLNDQSAYDLITKHEIDIAIDLNGHTSGSRMSLFSKKIAPIQVNYLGYAGTTGAKFYDYLIADSVAIPPEEEGHYTEKIARLPHSFFPIDVSHTPEILGDLPSRSSQNLPENAFVFACFNNSYKISPHIFEIWIRILEMTPHSVLWLSKSHERTMKNLTKEAYKRGISTERIIFAERVPSRINHLSRLRLADLFLDTPNYNAHATAADALWVGLPVLTILGQTFSGRIAASQISALGLPQLIVQSNEEYLAMAVDLANNRQYLSDIRNHIEKLRSTTPLFNMSEYVKNLESLFHNFYKNYLDS